MRSKKIISVWICFMSVLLTGCSVIGESADKPTVSIESEFLEILERNREQSTEEDRTQPEEKNSQPEVSGEAQTEPDSETNHTDQNAVSQTDDLPSNLPLWETAEDTDISFVQLEEQEKLEMLGQPIGAVILCMPQQNYYSRAAYKATNTFAVTYLQKLASLYYRDEAKEYGGITGTSYKTYVAWSEEKTGFFLDIIFGGQFTKEQLECDGDSILFHDGWYYIGIPAKPEETNIAVQYKSDGGEAADYVYDFLEEGSGRERRSGQLYISLQTSQLTYSDRYIFEIIVQ